MGPITTTQRYFGHQARAYARAISDDVFESSGAVEQESDTLAISGSLGVFRTRERALAQGLAWAKLWIDERRPVAKSNFATDQKTMT